MVTRQKKHCYVFIMLMYFHFLRALHLLEKKKDQQQSANVYLVATKKSEQLSEDFRGNNIPFQRAFIVNCL